MAVVCGMESLLVFTGDMTFERLQQLESFAETDETKLNLPTYYCDKLGDFGTFIQQFI